MMTIKDNTAILLTGYIGQAGAKKLVEQEKQRITERFSSFFLEPLTGRTVEREPDSRTEGEICAEILAVPGVKAADCGGQCTDSLVFPVGEGGFMKALWDMSESLNRGFCVRTNDLPISQEVIEICHFLGTNPYTLPCGEDVLLILTDDPHVIREELRNRGIRVTEIGQITSGRDKILLHSDGRRQYLNRP